MSAHPFRGKPLKGEDSPRWVLAYVLRVTFAPFFRLLWRVKVIGMDKLPAGAAILAGNHVSYLDPVLLWSVSPRPVHFVAKSELWRSRPLGWLLERAWVFPVNRGSADREMITTATNLLAAGDLLGMFPEGTRGGSQTPGELGEAQGGVSFIALRAGVPVVPVYFSGTEEAWGRRTKIPRLAKVTIRFGEPVYPDDFEGGRKLRMETLTAELMSRIAVLGDTQDVE